MEILTYDDLGRISSTLSVIHSHTLHLELKNLRRGGGRKKVEQEQALCILNLHDTNLTNAVDSLKVLQLKQFKYKKMQMKQIEMQYIVVKFLAIAVEL
jgi:hypothetical protein